MGSRLVRLVSICWLATALACGGDPQAPEQQVRAVIEATARAAEGNDKRALAAYVTFHVMRNKSRRVFTRIRSIEIRDTGRAEVVLIAAITGSSIRGPEELSGLHADVYKIDMDLDDEGNGDWRLVWAQWRSTAPTDLL